MFNTPFLPLKQHLHLIIYRSRVLLKTEGSRTYLSFLWWIIDPVIELCIFYTVFGLILQRGGPGFIVQLLTGIFVIRLFVSATSSAPTYLISNTNAILAMSIPKFIFPAAYTVTYYFKFIFLLTLLYIFLIVLGVTPQASNLMIIPITLLYMVFTLGVAMLLAGLTPFIPDISMFYPKVNMLLYWGSGVFFLPEQFLPPQYLTLFYANPIAGFIKAYRDCLLFGTININLLCYLALFSIVMSFTGYGFLVFFDKKLPRVLAQQ